MCADLYIAWAYYYDAINNFKQAEAVYQKGLECRAQPYEELVQAHATFKNSIPNRMLYDDELSKQQFKSTLDERRNALTSLRAHKKHHVGSIRTGAAVKHATPGIVNQENGSDNRNAASNVTVLEDHGVMQSTNVSSAQKNNVSLPFSVGTVHCGQSICSAQHCRQCT